MESCTEEGVTDWIERRGFIVIEVDEAECWGWVSLQDRIVAISKKLKNYQRVPVLLHEAVHIEYGHDGHQSRKVEDKVNETVAQLLVDPVDYAFCESQFGWSTGGIAAELGFPRWVIEAYRRLLARGEPVE